MTRAFGNWLGPAFGGRLDGGESPNATTLELRADLDQVEALTPEREALWARLESVSFLTEDEKRVAAGYQVLSRGASDSPSSSLPEAQVEAQKYSPDQPRVPSGNPDGGQWMTEGGGGRDVLAGGDGNDELAQAGDPRQYSVNLVEEDARGGHAVRDHVGKSDGELIEIVNNLVLRGGNVDIYAASFSSYDTLEAANDFTNQMLQTNPLVVDEVASGRIPSAWLDERFGYPTGREAFRPSATGNITIRKTYNAGVHDPRSSRGYRVHTSYPYSVYPK